MSYRREDSAGWAGRLVDDLAKKFGTANVFQDIHSIRPGADFIDAIDETLQKSDCVLVVIGPAWLTLGEKAGQRRLDDANDYVRLEVAMALRRSSPVIPVLVADAKMPAPATLPDDIKALARRTAAELTDRRWQYDVDQLARAIAPPDRPDDETKGRKKRRWFATVSFGRWSIALSAGIIGVVLHFLPPSSREPVQSAGNSAPMITSVVVFGGDPTPEAARPEMERARAAGFPSAAIYHRQGSYRSVVEFPTSDAAAAALPRIKGLSRAARDAYVVSLATWCPNAVRNASGVTECP